MRLFNEIAKRGAAILILAATVFATVTYSLGLYEISFIDRKGDEYDDNTIQEILGTLEPGTNISDFTGDITDVTLPPEISDIITTLAPGTTSAPDITLPPETSSLTTTAPGIDTEPSPAGCCATGGGAYSCRACTGPACGAWRRDGIHPSRV